LQNRNSTIVAVDRPDAFFVATLRQAELAVVKADKSDK